MIEVREATEGDIAGIREIFRESYGEHYSYPEYYDSQHLKRMIYGDDTILLVAEDSDTGDVVGTASIIVQVGAYADLVGEFGRLAVHPKARGQGVGKRLMAERVRRVEKRLHLGLVENRSAHTFSQRISAAHGFVPLGFIPLKLKFDHRESIALYGRHFGNALKLRRNHPRIISEVHPLAHQVLGDCGLGDDTIIEDDVAPYEHVDRFELEELTADGYTELLRIERGRVKNREVFGPIRLHYGLFLLEASRSNYLIAREEGRIVGGLGYLIDPHERAVRVFEVVASDERPVFFLFCQLICRCREQLDAALIEVDVSAYSPRLQRTLIELEFLPVAYIPAMVFHDVERLDAIKMVRLFLPLELGKPQLFERGRAIAETVIRSFQAREVLPRVADAIPAIPLFRDLTEDQQRQLASICRLESFESETLIYETGQPSDRIYILLSGEVEVMPSEAGSPSILVRPGECLGEMSLLRATPHSAAARARTAVEAAVIDHDDLLQLARRRPDVGATIFRNLARGLTEKLASLDDRFLETRPNQ